MNKINEKIMYTSYKRNNKWLGIIDYKSLCFILVYMFILISILDGLNLSIDAMIYIFLFLSVPVISLIVINVNNESAISVIFSIFFFVISRGIYVQKEHNTKQMSQIKIDIEK